MYTNRYSNIYVTSPSPENLKTLFEFVFKGFDALEYQVCACVVCCNVYWWCWAYAVLLVLRWSLYQSASHLSVHLYALHTYMICSKMFHDGNFSKRVNVRTQFCQGIAFILGFTTRKWRLSRQCVSVKAYHSIMCSGCYQPLPPSSSSHRSMKTTRSSSPPIQSLTRLLSE